MSGISSTDREAEVIVVSEPTQNSRCENYGICLRERDRNPYARSPLDSCNNPHKHKPSYCSLVLDSDDH